MCYMDGKVITPKLVLGKSKTMLLGLVVSRAVIEPLWRSIRKSVSMGVNAAVVNSVITPLQNSTRWTIRL